MHTNNIIIVTDRELFPEEYGNHTRILALIDGFRAYGYGVILITIRGAKSVETLAKLRNRVTHLVVLDCHTFQGGDPTGFDVPQYREAVAAAAKMFNPVAVIAEYPYLVPCLQGVPPGVLRVVDTHDVMHLRTARFQAQGVDLLGRMQSRGRDLTSQTG